MTSFLEKHFRLLAALPLLLMTTLQISSIVLESQTFDEAVHLTAGYRYWRTGHFNLNWEHPPLQKLLSALPLAILRPPLPDDPKLLADEYEFARAFLYKGPENADRLLLLGRMATILLTFCLGVTVAWTTRHHFGAPAALLALCLFSLEPNIIAHGRYVTTDLAAALFFFLTIALWIRYLYRPEPRSAVWTGLALGLGLTSKFSLVLLVPLLPLLFLLRWIMARWDRGVALRRAAFSAAAVAVASALVVALVYAPETWRTLRGRNRDVTRVSVAGVTLPPHTFFTGLNTVLRHNEEGHPAYLLGEFSDKGWWYYFPVAFAVKSPTALLLALLVAVGIALGKIPRVWRDPPAAFLWLAVLLPPLAYFAASMTSHINIGIRHLLPVYPFFYVLTASALVKALPGRAALVAASLLVVIQGIEIANIHPDYLTFFNTLAGGPEAGPKYLLDSNLDWGQDLKKLKVFMDDNRLPSVCLYYFGYAAPAYYGIKEEYLPKTWDKDELGRMDCIGAISVTLLHDLYIKPGSFEWLRRRRPLGTVGNSIYIYDLRKRRQ